MQPNIIIGGVGGSGTRVVCSIAQLSGFYMGADLNKAQDALWFSLLFMHPGMMSCPDDKFHALAELYTKAFTGGGLTRAQTKTIQDLGRVEHSRWSAEWVTARAESFIQAAQNQDRHRLWGWKEPNSHIFIERFLKIWPNVKYLHMWRDGIDMSVAKNKNQIKFWEHEYPGGPYNASQKSSLSYWVNVHKKIVDLTRIYPGRVSFLNFEDLCESPRAEIKKFMAFTNQDAGHDKVTVLSDLVVPPKTLGRGHDVDVSEYDPLDYSYALNFKNHLRDLSLI